MQRLRASFDYVKKQYTYYCWRESVEIQTERISPKICFPRRRGDRVSYAAAAYLANAVGMKKS